MASGPVADKRIVLYPTYIDSTQTVAEGRVLSKEDACPEPDVVEMLECCKKLNLQAIIEDKHYPRAWWVRGRVRTSLRKPDGTLVDVSIPTKRQLLKRIAEMIKATPNRPKRRNVFSIANMPGALGGGAGPSGSGGAGAGGSGAAGGASSSKAGGGTSNKKKNKGKK